MSATLGPRLAAGLVFLTSGSVLVLEILSLRLVAPYVGLTLETNTAVIGVALAAIAAGAWLGGRFADLIAPEKLLGPLTLGGGVLVLLVAPLVRWTGELVRGADVSAVVLMAGIAVFAPAALLAAVTPVVVKARLASLAQTGSVVGRLSGVGTLGAIAATFATGFVLVAMVPTTTILLALGGLLIVAGAALTIRLRGGVRPVAAPLAVALIGALATVVAPEPCDLETVYHCAKVSGDSTRPTGRVLQLDTLRHSYVDLADPEHLEFAYVRGIAAAADAFRPAGVPVRALHVGGGGLTLPRYLAASRPGSASLVLEIDAGVLRIDREQLGFRPGGGIDTRVVDGRIGVAEQPAGSRDLVVGDAFGGIAVPWHLTTRELVTDVRRVLADDGLYAVNIIDRPPLAFVRAEVATIAAVFPHVAIVARSAALAGQEGGNFVVLASDRPLPEEAVRQRLVERGGELQLSGGESVARFAGDARVLTDDFAPVDQLLTP